MRSSDIHPVSRAGATDSKDMTYSTPVLPFCPVNRRTRTCMSDFRTAKGCSSSTRNISLQRVPIIYARNGTGWLDCELDKKKCITWQEREAGVRWTIVCSIGLILAQAEEKRTKNALNTNTYTSLEANGATMTCTTRGNKRRNGAVCRAVSLKASGPSKQAGIFSRQK